MLVVLRPFRYFTHARASPGWGKIVSEPVLQGAGWFVNPGLVIDTPGVGVGKANSTGTPSGTGLPEESVTKALTTMVRVPSPLLLGKPVGRLTAIC